jgi:hypothetical protein
MEMLVNETEEKVIEMDELFFIREKVEAMNKFNQVEVLRILEKKKVTLNENKYGVHINLTELSANVIEELKSYIHYVSNQEIDLNQLEEKKETFKATYFSTNNIVKNSPSTSTSTSTFKKSGAKPHLKKVEQNHFS